MLIADLDDIALHYREDGDPAGRPVLLVNSLGTDLRLWDRLVARLPARLRVIRYDKRGHGLSQAPAAPYAMDSLVDDAAALLDRLEARGAVVVGCSIGGMIAQGLAHKRPDLVAAMVLSNTAAKIGTPGMWGERIRTVGTGGIEALADAVMERWFTPAFRATPELVAWRNMLTRTPADGYAGCSAAIAGADFTASTAALTLPTLAVAGDHDGSTPPELVRDTAGKIAGARFELIGGAGHLPMVEQPDDFARALIAFIEETENVRDS